MDLHQNEKTVWRLSFEMKLDKFRKDLVTKVANIPKCAVNVAVLDELLKKAQEVGRKRNTVIPGALQIHPEGNVIFKNLAHGGTHPVGSAAMDEVRIEVMRLYHLFVDARAVCIKTRLLGGVHWARSEPHK